MSGSNLYQLAQTFYQEGGKLLMLILVMHFLFGSTQGGGAGQRSNGF